MPITLKCDICGGSYEAGDRFIRRTNLQVCSPACKWKLTLAKQPPEKTCAECGEDKPASKFPTSRGKLTAECWACVYKRQGKRPAYKAYGLDQQSFDTMRQAQNDCCAICSKPFTATPCVDHCHTTNKVRGLLCRRCNIGLGMFKDDARSLEHAIKYLQIPIA